MYASDVRKGDWMQTYLGAKFYPLDARPEEVSITDIAKALGKLCRFGGHCLRFYSVAEHCVLLAKAMPKEFQFRALMDDAAEGYLGDMIRPIKNDSPEYKQREAALSAIILPRFGLDPECPPLLTECDQRILTDEQTQNMAKPPEQWITRAEPLGVTLQFWPPEEAARQFLIMFNQLCREEDRVKISPVRPSMYYAEQARMMAAQVKQDETMYLSVRRSISQLLQQLAGIIEMRSTPDERGALALALTQRMIIDMPTARAAIDEAWKTREDEDEDNE